MAGAKKLSHFIGGEHVAGQRGRFGDVFNPASASPLRNDYMMDRIAQTEIRILDEAIGQPLMGKLSGD